MEDMNMILQGEKWVVDLDDRKWVIESEDDNVLHVSMERDRRVVTSMAKARIRNDEYIGTVNTKFSGDEYNIGVTGLGLFIRTDGGE
jgi:hypothetical protein